MHTRGRDVSLDAFVMRHKNDVPYVRQSFAWDCGLACAEMALRARGVSVTVSDLRKLCETDSIWSIDISYLLHRFGVLLTFFTVTRGVRVEYRKQEFYRKQLPEDTKRVTALFENAERRGVHVVEQSVDLRDIVQAVVNDNKIVLVLLDKRLLSCTLCDRRRSNCVQAQQPEHFGENTRATSGFLGHYVLLYAYDAKVDKFLMKDPASMCDACVISANVLESARKAFGTDQDIIFIGGVTGSPYGAGDGEPS
jgi:Guanylylate cyclase